MTLHIGAGPRWRRIGWGLLAFAALGGVLWLAVAAPTVSVPLLIAFIIAYLLDPVVDWFEARGIQRTPAIAIILGIFLLFVGGLALLVVPQVIREFAQIPGKLKEFVSHAVPWVEQRLGVTAPRNLQDALDAVQRELAGLEVKSLVGPTLKLLRGVYGGTMGLLAGFAALVMIPVFAFYLLRDFDELVAEIRALIPMRYRASVGARFAEIDAAMSSFIRGQLTVAAVLSALYALGLWIAGLPLALVVGLIAGLGNMIPYVGTAIGVVLAAVLCLLSGEGWPIFAKVAGVFVVVQGLEGWVITPKIVGESVGLSPFAVIVAVLFFGELFGFVGVLVAVPLAAILKILLRVGLEAYRKSPFFTS